MQLDSIQIDANGSSFFSGLAYSGEPMPDKEHGMVAIDLSTLTSKKSKIDLFIDHKIKGELALGSAEVEISNMIFIKKGEVYNHTDIPKSKSISALIEKKHPLQLSIGISGSLKKFKQATNINVNGKNQLVNAVMVNGKLNEVSFVTDPRDEASYAMKMSKEKQDIEYLEEINQPITLNKEAVAMSESITIELSKANAEIEQLKQENITLQKEKEAEKQASKIAQVKFAFSKFNLADELIADIALMSEAGQKAMLEREEASLKFRAESLQAQAGASDKQEQIKTFLGQEV
jgi:hypothetical protein